MTEHLKVVIQQQLQVQPSHPVSATRSSLPELWQLVPAATTTHVEAEAFVAASMDEAHESWTTQSAAAAKGLMEVRPLQPEVLHTICCRDS